MSLQQAATTLRPIALGPIVAAAVGAACAAAGLPNPASVCAAITALCATWWVTEALPIPVTSMIPFAAFPLTGVLSHQQVAQSYGDTLILLLLGGFMLSTSMEKSGAHRRLALYMVRAVGARQPRRIVLGFMLTSAVLSMWISNSATTLMLLPIAAAVIEQDARLGKPLMLGIAYSASIGGLGTPIGTPPNVVFMSVFQETTGRELGFVDWMRIGVPAVFAMLPFAYWRVTRLHLPAGNSDAVAELPPVGVWRPAERRVLFVFAVTALAWITRLQPMGGWSSLFGVPSAGDSSVALAAVVALFVMPDGRGGRLLDWNTAAKIPWGLLILFAGGLAIARAFSETGLSRFLAEGLAGLTDLHFVVLAGILCLGVTFLTEVTSNTATAALLMPILAAAAFGAGLAPDLLMIPAALSASCAFMLPVATAPNAIVLGTGALATRDMARAGVWLNVVGAAVITALCALLLPL